MKDDRVRIAVVGVGHFGYVHAKKIVALDNARLGAVVDIRPERAREVAAELGVRAAATPAEILDDIDAAVVASSSPVHAELAIELMRAGKDVLCEKPMALTPEETAAMVRTAVETGRILQVGHLERFGPAVEELLVRAKSPGFIEAHRISPVKPRALGVDVVLDVMIHDLDIVLALANATPVDIRAVGAPVVGRHPDIVNARLEFPGGCVANLTSSRLALKEERRMRVFQPNSFLTLDLDREELLEVKAVAFGKDGPRVVEHDRPRFEPSDKLERELRSFADCVRERTPPRVDGVWARGVTECAFAIRDEVRKRLGDWDGRSAELGRWITMEES